MTRTGKSNTTKIVLKTIFELRWQPAALRIGQVIFDPNGDVWSRFCTAEATFRPRE
jgi:hypothetical protein